MMTAQQFHLQSKSVFTQGRSELIQDIERLLAHFQGTSSYNRKMKIAGLIYFESKMHATTNPNSKRRTAVRRVRDQAKAFLDSGYSLMMLDQKVNSGMSTKGTPANPKHVSFKFGGKGLDSHYKWEVILPNKRIVSKCGSSLEQVINDDKYFGMSDIKDAVASAITKPSEAIDALLDKWFDPSDHDTRKFLQMNSQERVNYQLSIDNGSVIWAKTPNQPFSMQYCTCTHSAGEEACVKDAMNGYPFAMDLDDNIYVWGGNLSNVNHSSFMSGKPVKCAGMLHVQNGKIVGINNGSGHYKPSTGFLAAAVDTIINVYGQSPHSLRVWDLTKPQQEPMTGAKFQRQHGLG